jgi:hypothetical protein
MDEAGQKGQRAVNILIRNEETCRMIHELATLLSVSAEEAVRIAVEDKLAQLKAERKSKRLEWLENMTRETAALMNDGRTSKELMDELYDDETGLPK